jgi:hypothetical protein
MKCEVNDVHIFYQIIRERRNPLAVLREAISNAWDAHAKKVKIDITKNSNGGIDLVIVDNGDGMKRSDFKSFFGLAFSDKDEVLNIGNKGLGTKLFFNSDHVEVMSRSPSQQLYLGTLDKPLAKLENGVVPTYLLKRIKGRKGIGRGTQISIENLNVSSGSAFLSGDLLKSYIKWHTASGNCSKLFRRRGRGITTVIRRELADESQEEIKVNGHEIPKENSELNIPPEKFANVFDPFTVKIPKRGISGTALVEIAGAVCGSEAHVVKDKRLKKRYKGIFLAKDYFIVKNISNEVFRGSGEWQNFHVIANCQALELTMNREGVLDTSGGLVYSQVIGVLREFSNAVKRGERFRLSGRAVEMSKRYAGRGYSRLKELKSEYMGSKIESSRIMQILAAGSSDHMPTYDLGGPLLEPQGPRGVMLLFQSLLNLSRRSKKKDVLRLANYRVLAPLEEGEFEILIERKGKGVEWGHPEWFRVTHGLAVKDFNGIDNGVSGVICWELDGHEDIESFKKKCKPETRGLELVVLRHEVDRMFG